MFYSIQGEGMLAGVPSVFIRTSGCNLRCRWCDSWYTSWEPEGEERSLEEILEFVRRHSRGYTVVTGGEPMISKEIVPLTRKLRELGQHITIETAGTVYAPVECDLMSISPKLRNSTPARAQAGEWAERHERTRIRLDVLKRLMECYPYQLKFVVCDPGDIQEIVELVERLGACRDRVLLMAEGTDRETLAERGRWLAELCKQYGYRFTPRLHIELWGHQRGV